MDILDRMENSQPFTVGRLPKTEGAPDFLPADLQEKVRMNAAAAYGAVREKELIGVAVVADLQKEEPVASLEYLFVKEKWRGQYAASELLEHVYAELQRQKKQGVRATLIGDGEDSMELERFLLGLDYVKIPMTRFTLTFDKENLLKGGALDTLHVGKLSFDIRPLSQLQGKQYQQLCTGCDTDVSFYVELNGMPVCFLPVKRLLQKGFLFTEAVPFSEQSGRQMDNNGLMQGMLFLSAIEKLCKQEDCREIEIMCGREDDAKQLIKVFQTEGKRTDVHTYCYRF